MKPLFVCLFALCAGCYSITKVALPNGSLGFDIWCQDTLIGCFNSAAEQCLTVGSSRYLIVATQTEPLTSRTRMLVECAK
jgi:hypothetical protein